MGLLRPATPGFLVTTLATVLLLVVSFSVPWFKSVYFLKAQVSQSGQSGFITFGVLGYCTTINGGATNCTSAKIGYEFDPNALLGDNIKFLQIPSVVVKWITWALVLHIVAFGLAAVSAIFGLLAHIREFSMTCFSSCISGFAATVALFAFIFDLVLFFTVKSRINHVKGGSAVIGNAVWLTLASWVLLFFSGCFYTIGRCCITRRPRSPSNDKWRSGDENGSSGKPNNYTELMRLDAVKAEADRKARQAAGERGLPSFPTLEERKPLSSNYEATYLEEDESTSSYQDNVAGIGRVAGPRSPRRQPTDISTQSVARSAAATTGYTPGNPGSRTIDQYNNVTSQPNTYPPQTSSHVSQRQPSTSPGPQYDTNAYQPGNNHYNSKAQSTGAGQYVMPSHEHYNDPSPTSNQSTYATIATAAGVAGAGAYPSQKRYSRDQSYDNNYYNQPTHSQPQASTGAYSYEHGQDQTTYHSAYTHPQDYSQYNQEGYANTNPYMSMLNPHDNADPSLHNYSSAYPSSNIIPQPTTSQHQTLYYTPPTGGSTGFNANLNPIDYYEARPKNSGTSYFSYDGNQEQNPYSHYKSPSPAGLHTVQEASGSSSEHPPVYSQGSHAPGSWLNEKS